MRSNQLNLHIRDRYKELLDAEKRSLQTALCDVAKFTFLHKDIFTIRGRKRNHKSYKNYLDQVHVDDKRGFSTTKQKWYKRTTHLCRCHRFVVYEQIQFIKT